MEEISNIIGQIAALSLVASTVFGTLFSIFKTSKKMDEYSQNQSSIKRSILRLELLTSIHYNPEKTDVIMDTAFAYFEKEKGNWVGSAHYDDWRKKYAKDAPDAETLKSRLENKRNKE